MREEKEKKRREDEEREWKKSVRERSKYVK